MQCTRCGSHVAAGDNYCRGCGAALRTGLPAPLGTVLPAVREPRAPMLVRGGIAAAAAGIALSLLRRYLAARATKAAQGLPDLFSSPAIAKDNARKARSLSPEVAAESILVIWRRILR